MKQSQVNKFFTNLAGCQLISNVGTPTTTAPSKHNKNASSTISNGNKYLVYSKRTSRLHLESTKKLPVLTTVMKTETQETPKTATIKMRKASGNSGDFRIIHQHQRNKTETLTLSNNINISKLDSPKENFEEVEQLYVQQNIQHTATIPTQIAHAVEILQSALTSTRSEIITKQALPKVNPVQVLGETYEFTKIPKISSKIKRTEINQQITEIESLNEKSCHLMRKLRQLLHTHREKEKLLELEIKKKKESLIDRQFSKTLSNMPDEKTPKAIESKFNFKLSTITKKQTRIHPNYSIYDNESMLPIKTIIDALKEKKDEKQEKVQIIQQIQKKNIKVTVAFEENEKEIEFQMPDYIGDFQQSQIQSTEIKDNKQSNIYSLVSKSMLQKQISQDICSKFALRLVKKFGDKVIKTQKDNDAIENFNSFKASQFTRYYLQNHIQKCLEIKYEPQQENEEISTCQKQSFLNKNYYSETMQEIQSKNMLQITQQHKDQYKSQCEVQTLFYTIGQHQEGHLSDNSILSPNVSQLDTSDIEMQTQFKINYIYYMLNLISPNDIKQQKLRVIVNTIDDETKNQLLHQDLLRFPQIIKTLEKKIKNDPENNQLQILNDLETELLTTDLTILQTQFSIKYNYILTGQFEDFLHHQVTQMEKIYVEYCKTQIDLDSAKITDRQFTNLNIPQNSRSRLASPIGSNESKLTRKEINPLLAKGMMLKKNQKSKNLLATQKFASSQNIIYKSSRNLQALLHANTNSNHNIQQFQSSHQVRTFQKESEQQTKSKSSQQHISIKSNLITQQSMDPSSLLFRSMLLHESQQNDKSNIDRAFSLIEDHRLQDLKDLINHDQNINLNTQDYNGNTFLIQAARTGAFEIIQYLLRKGAEITIKNNDGLNAIQIAIIHLQFEAADEINRFSRSNSFISH
ncbi:unnamed protein product (macronuclear) [Paramecium tetraurelia]|uniref:Uncharacterized protein n=1 Tax=Paramecium tetraurelia TaxID=5888 RepID=A0DXV2_PARTE|nr:uncharacterized protein GSPATT00021493001 [Paramecium tetraurelia]CAK87869.1 unnamed protein product [Paramecium tetraurelia]|eukprot:XP_001455266.1 hypothetical protein (macronuclear) [Paramecium tetraurelia strain d4-2]